MTDWEIIDRYTPGHLKTEFGGVAGISYSLRQMALIDAVTADMAAYCPAAWLLNVANPLPRVAQAAAENGIKTGGFCAVSMSAYGMLWQLIKGEQIDYPWTKAQSAWDVVSAGLNHFAWVTAIRERDGGDDLLPLVRERVAAGGSTGQPRADAMLRETGYLLVPGDDHTRDFLPPNGVVIGQEHAPWHGDPQERVRRLALLDAVANGVERWDELLVGAAWEKPVGFIAALNGAAPAHFHSMNLLNEGQITNLPRGIFVETPCDVSSGSVRPTTVTLPSSVLPFCERTARVTDKIVRAARLHSHQTLMDAVDLDPTITDKHAGKLAMNHCIAAHADLVLVCVSLTLA